MLGAIGVVELDRTVESTAMSERFAAEGTWIRPFGRIVYLTPAFVISDRDLDGLTAAIRKVLGSAQNA